MNKRVCGTSRDVGGRRMERGERTDYLSRNFGRAAEKAAFFVLREKNGRCVKRVLTRMVQGFQRFAGKGRRGAFNAKCARGAEVGAEAKKVNKIAGFRRNRLVEGAEVSNAIYSVFNE